TIDQSDVPDRTQEEGVALSERQKRPAGVQDCRDGVGETDAFTPPAQVLVCAGVPELDRVVPRTADQSSVRSEDDRAGPTRMATEGPDPTPRLQVPDLEMGRTQLLPQGQGFSVRTQLDVLHRLRSQAQQLLPAGRVHDAQDDRVLEPILASEGQ